MKTLSRLLMLAALAAAFSLPAFAQDPAASPAATGPCEEAARGELYTQYYNAKKTDQPKAYELGKQYLAKYESCADNYTASVKKFVNIYGKAVLRNNFFNAYNAKDVAKLNALGKQLLASDPNDAAAAMLSAVGVYQAVQAKNPAATDADADMFVGKAIELIEAGKVPTDLESKPSWLPFTSKDDALGYLTFTRAAQLEKANNNGEAVKLLMKVAQSASKSKEDPLLYASLARLYKIEAAPMFEKYQTYKEPTPESQLLLLNINQVVDRLIDAYARAVAYSATPADKAKYMADLTELYKSRHEGTDKGLTELIAGIKAQPLMMTQPITALPAPTPENGAGDGTAAGAQTTPAAAPVANPAATAAKPAPTSTTTTTAKPAPATTTAPAKKRP
ncbi:MAG: hypothetical protein LC785_00905 [Acidobacteria bacterium]|nr:hypothetical protein [Acidobacteriota bacterium]MCA1640548.1 hypothetical protein [Acidobacteriota bacterium]